MRASVVSDCMSTALKLSELAGLPLSLANVSENRRKIPRSEFLKARTMGNQRNLLGSTIQGPSSPIIVPLEIPPAGGIEGSDTKAEFYRINGG